MGQINVRVTELPARKKKIQEIVKFFSNLEKMLNPQIQEAQ